MVSHLCYADAALPLTQPPVGGAVRWSERWLEISGGILTCLSMCDCCSRAFDLCSGGLLPCLNPVYSNMFDTWYPDMFWHVWCQRMLLVVHHCVCVMFAQTLLTGCCYVFVLFATAMLKSMFRWHTARWYTDMFWHVCCLPLHNVSWRGCVRLIFCMVLCDRRQVQ